MATQIPSTGLAWGPCHDCGARIWTNPTSPQPQRCPPCGFARSLARRPETRPGHEEETMAPTFAYKPSMPRTRAELAADEINAHLTTRGPISLNGNPATEWGVRAVRAQRGLNKWGVQADFHGGYQDRVSWTWLNQTSLDIIADAMRTPTPAPAETYRCDTCGTDVADHPWYCVYCAVVVCTRCWYDHNRHPDPSMPTTPAPREAALCADEEETLCAQIPASITALTVTATGATTDAAPGPLTTAAPLAACAACGTAYDFCPDDPEERRIFCRVHCWGHCPACNREGR